MPLKFILKGKSYGITNSILEKNKGSEYYYQFQDCINYLSHCCDKIPDKSNLRKNLFLIAVPGDIMQHGRKEQWQQRETAVQIVSTAERKHSDECLCSAHFLFIYSVRDHSP